MAIRQVTRAGVGLVIGIILLAILVFAGLWFIRERSEQVRREEAINIADQQLQTESEQGVALNEDDADSNKESENSGSSSSQSNGSTSTNPSSTATELPKTGPESTAFVAIGLLTFASISFIRSRKLLAHRS